jgi:hypothetical protein
MAGEINQTANRILIIIFTVGVVLCTGRPNPEMLAVPSQLLLMLHLHSCLRVLVQV